MKKNLIIILSLSFMAIFITTVQAQMDHSSHQDRNMQRKNPHTGHENHAAKQDENIRRALVDGYHFNYQLIDIRAKVADAKDMPAGMKSHHLMVYIKDTAGKALAGRTGYLITGPDNTTQKIMTMGMDGGYGADINLSSKGIYKIKTKIRAGSINLSDSFEYVVQ